MAAITATATTTATSRRTRSRQAIADERGKPRRPQPVSRCAQQAPRPARAAGAAAAARCSALDRQQRPRFASDVQRAVRDVRCADQRDSAQRRHSSSRPISATADAIIDQVRPTRDPAQSSSSRSDRTARSGDRNDWNRRNDGHDGQGTQQQFGATEPALGERQLEPQLAQRPSLRLAAITATTTGRCSTSAFYYDPFGWGYQLVQHRLAAAAELLRPATTGSTIRAMYGLPYPPPGMTGCATGTTRCWSTSRAAKSWT